MPINLTRRHVSDLAKAMPGKHTSNMDVIARVFGFPSQTALMASLKAEESPPLQLVAAQVFADDISIDDLIGRLLSRHLDALKGKRSDPLSRGVWQTAALSGDVRNFPTWRAERIRELVDGIRVGRLLDTFTSPSATKREVRDFEDAFPDAFDRLIAFDGPAALGGKAWDVLSLVCQAISAGDDHLILDEEGGPLLIRGKSLLQDFRGRLLEELSVTPSPARAASIDLSVDQMLSEIFRKHLGHFRNTEADAYSRSEWLADVNDGDGRGFEEWHAAQCESFGENVRMSGLIDRAAALATLSETEAAALERDFREQVALLRAFGGEDVLGNTWDALTRMEVTLHAKRETRFAFLNLGVDHYMTGPYMANYLRGLVRKDYLASDARVPEPVMACYDGPSP